MVFLDYGRKFSSFNELFRVWTNLLKLFFSLLSIYVMCNIETKNVSLVILVVWKLGSDVATIRIYGLWFFIFMFQCDNS